MTSNPDYHELERNPKYSVEDAALRRRRNRIISPWQAQPMISLKNDLAYTSEESDNQ